MALSPVKFRHFSMAFSLPPARPAPPPALPLPLLKRRALRAKSVVSPRGESRLSGATNASEEYSVTSERDLSGLSPSLESLLFMAEISTRISSEGI
jgi:hypothetical protein